MSLTLLSLARLPGAARVLGPVPIEPSAWPPGAPGTEGPARVRALVTVPAAVGAALATELRGAAGVRSARKDGGPVTVRIDPAAMA